jgi:O-antigen ligase
MHYALDSRSEPYAPVYNERTAYTTFLIWVFVLGWVTQEFTLFNVGTHSIPLIYLIAIPFCLRATSQSITFLLLPLISAIMAVVVGALQGSAEPMSILSQSVLQFLAILFAAGAASMNWRKCLDTLTEATVVIGFPIVAFGGYQMLARMHRWKYAFLPVTNLQAHAIGDLQRGWEKDGFSRASSIFVEPSEFGYYCSWLLLLGLTATKPRWRMSALILAFTGILFSQSLSAVLAAAVLIVCYVATNGVSINVVRQVAIVVLLSVMALLTVAPLVPEAVNKFYERVEQAVTLDSRADSGRVDHLPENWMMFKEAPVFGTGIASISSADSSGVDVTTFTYFLMLIERGLVGTCFFMAPFIWLTWRAFKLPKADPYRIICVLFGVLNLYTFWVSSMAYTLNYWLALAIAASCILGTYLPSSHFALREIFLPGDGQAASNDLTAYPR